MFPMLRLITALPTLSEQRIVRDCTIYFLLEH